MIDTPRRLRRAILLADLPLVQRIIRTNPTYLLNPDFADRSNTSLHLAAKHGHAPIVEFLIEQGHEDEMVSRNNDDETPLMHAAQAGKEEVGVMLAKAFPGCVAWRDGSGVDALMMACASGSGTLHLIPTLITLAPEILTAADHTGNTALHHASAAGELKALRLLLQYGANPLASNSFSWTPVHYSATGAAEAYFKTLIIEFEKMKAEGKRGARERERQARAGVRLVTDSEEGDSTSVAASTTPLTATTSASSSVSTATGVLSSSNPTSSSAFSAGGFGTAAGFGNVGDRQRARDDAVGAGLPAPGMEWSPVEKRRAITPTEGRGWTFMPEGMRPRAETGGSI